MNKARSSYANAIHIQARKIVRAQQLAQAEQRLLQPHRRWFVLDVVVQAVQILSRCLLFKAIVEDRRIARIRAGEGNDACDKLSKRSRCSPDPRVSGSKAAEAIAPPAREQTYPAQTE